MLNQAAMAGTLLPLGASLYEYIGMNTLQNIGELLYAKKKGLPYDMRFSLFAGMQIDRAALLALWSTSAVLEMQPLVRALPRKKS